MRGTPPGPRGHWLLGSLPDFGTDLLGLLTRVAREHGDVVRLRLGPVTQALLLSHPERIEEVLATREGEFAKHRFFWRHVSRLFGDGLLTSSGELWKRQHALIAPAFRQQRLALSAEAMAAAANDLVAGWRDGEERDVRHDMSRLTLDIAARVLFDRRLDHDALDRVLHAVDLATAEIGGRFRRFLTPPDWVPTPGNRRYLAAARALDAVAAEIVGERRATAEGRSDLLSTLLLSRDPEGRPMHPRQVRDEVVTLLLAGHETTALALTWTLHLLAHHPEVAARVEAEVDAVVGPDRPPSVVDLADLRYVAAVLTEAMRLYPPVYVVGRETIREVELGGYRVPRGTVLLMSQWVVHRDERFFPEPLAFEPERWTDGSARGLPRFAYFPFGGGARICIGQPLALMEAKLVLAGICQRFRLADHDGGVIEPSASITLRPNRAVRLRVSRRPSSGSPAGRAT
jgi:cytochrome P450